MDEVPVGAVIVHDGKIIGEGYNLRESEKNALRHAELIAIEAASRALGDWRLNACELWVTLEPCPMCLGALQQARIGSVRFGAFDAKGGALSLGYKLNEDTRTNHRFVCGPALDSECEAVLRAFFQKKREARKRGGAGE